GTVILTGGNDRAILTASGTIAALRADDIPLDLLARARHVHVASYFLLDGLRPGLADLARDAHEAGTSVSVDPNWDPAQNWDQGIRALLPLVDVFLPNEAEALAISGQASLNAAADELVDRLGCAVVAIKRGEAGVLAGRRG